MSTRAFANVYTIKDGQPSVLGEVKIPSVFTARVRPDMVRKVTNLKLLSTRQAQGVKEEAGYQTAARSWGTGRAVARVPRVAGGGSHRSGQAAFANFCRGGGMFAPLKVWRKFGKRVNQKQAQQVQAFCFSAAGTTGLVMAKGHKIDNIPELPLVVTDGITTIQKTMDLKMFLRGLGLGEELERCEKRCKTVRAGKGKMRGRKFRNGKGPLIVVHENSMGLVRASKKLKGVEIMNVDRANTIDMAPGYTAGRLMIFTKSALERLADHFGDENGISKTKTKYKAPRSCLTAENIGKVINSEAVQKVIRPKINCPNQKYLQKGKQPSALECKKLMEKLNPARDSMKQPLK